MITILFYVLLFIVFGKILSIGLKAAWGLAKILLSVVFSPLVLVVLVIAGLIKIAFPILLVIGIIVLIKSVAKV